MTIENNKLDFTTLFRSTGLHTTGSVTVNEYTHIFDPHLPKRDWLYPALLGFKEYKKRFDSTDSFATIGCGTAIDAIGACEIFNPHHIFLTDIHPEIPTLAKNNVRQFVNKNTTVIALQGDLCKPLLDRSIKVDVAYANIPNIPSEQPVFGNISSSSFYQQRDDKNCPKVFRDNLLTLQYFFLKEAKQILNKGGAVIDAVSGKAPYGILQELFTANGYQFSELISIFNIQTEPEEELGGYSRAEREFGVTFDFYYYDEAERRWLEIEGASLMGPELKEELKAYRVTATQAYEEYKKSKKNFGRIMHILCGKLK